MIHYTKHKDQTNKKLIYIQIKIHLIIFNGHHVKNAFGLYFEAYQTLMVTILNVPRHFFFNSTPLSIMICLVKLNV